MPDHAFRPFSGCSAKLIFGIFHSYHRTISTITMKDRKYLNLVAIRNIDSEYNITNELAAMIFQTEGDFLVKFGILLVQISLINL